MAVRVGIYTGYPTEERPYTLLVDLGLDPSGEAVLSAMRSASPGSWLGFMSTEGGQLTFQLIAGMDLTGLDRYDIHAV